VTSRFLPAAFACLFASHAAALLTRTDRDDAEYLELASRYTSSVRLSAAGGEGVLIAPRWVLTSAERAKAVARLKIGSREYPIQSTHTEGQSGIALLFLRQAVQDVEPTPVYRERDEAGKALVITGHGGDGRKRAGINTVDTVTERALQVRIKQGDDASDLQGALTPAEIGAAAYVEVEREPFVAGIAVAVANGRETYARLSSLAEWIDQTMFKAAAMEAADSTAPRPRAR
jgi:hypothetical protein